MTPGTARTFPASGRNSRAEFTKEIYRHKSRSGTMLDEGSGAISMESVDSGAWASVLAGLASFPLACFVAWLSLRLLMSVISPRR